MDTVSVGGGGFCHLDHLRSKRSGYPYIRRRTSDCVSLRESVKGTLLGWEKRFWRASGEWRVLLYPDSRRFFRYAENDDPQIVSNEVHIPCRRGMVVLCAAGQVALDPACPDSSGMPRLRCENEATVTNLTGEFSAFRDILLCA